MEVYVVNLVVSEGFDMGGESRPQVFTDYKKAKEYGYELYCDEWNNCIENEEIIDGRDDFDNEKLSKKEFMVEFEKDCDVVVIQLSDYHIQVELYLCEVR